MTVEAEDNAASKRSDHKGLAKLPDRLKWDWLLNLVLGALLRAVGVVSMR